MPYGGVFSTLHFSVPIRQCCRLPRKAAPSWPRVALWTLNVGPQRKVWRAKRNMAFALSTYVEEVCLAVGAESKIASVRNIG